MKGTFRSKNLNVPWRPVCLFWRQQACGTSVFLSIYRKTHTSDWWLWRGLKSVIRASKLGGCFGAHWRKAPLT